MIKNGPWTTKYRYNHEESWRIGTNLMIKSAQRRIKESDDEYKLIKHEDDKESDKESAVMKNRHEVEKSKNRIWREESARKDERRIIEMNREKNCRDESWEGS